MARQSGIYKSQLPDKIQKLGYISQQRRIYERIDGKFVGIGFKLIMRKYRPDKEDIFSTVFIQDEDLDRYSFN